MTDDQTPGRPKLTLDINFPVLDPDALRHALAPLAKLVTPRADRLAARAALGALLDGDDQAAAEHLDGLDADQLYAIEGAGSALAIHASRLRKPMVDAEWNAAAQAEDELVVDVAPDPTAFREAVAQALDEDAHTCEWRALAERTLRDLRQETERADAAHVRAQRLGAALDAANRRTDRQVRRAERAEADRDAQQRLAIDAGAKRDEFRTEMLRIGDLLGDACRRVEDTERRLAEMRDRAERAEGEAKDWRTVAKRAGLEPL